jgi:hypothetical protein
VQHEDSEMTVQRSQPNSVDAIALAIKALEPFALNPGAISLSAALGHISRENLLAAKEAVDTLLVARASPSQPTSPSVDAIAAASSQPLASSR